ncbi:hypothetical protein TIFTF001_031403 [Ficus carica]|uniref:Uncharacterized protein n=1 Tax=Ficus carica TaxID=3494 RepID=A0AA88DV84_FICCA|nr:hypothetical protein TIFTF001_031403 [Ficus carica]
MFLICNGLLVFLAKYSGLVRSLSLTSHQDESRSNIVIESSHSDLSMEKEVENVAVKEGNEEEFSFTNQREIETEVEIEEAITEGKEQEQGSRIMASKEEEEEEEEEENKEESSLVHVADLSNDSFLAEQGTKEEDEEDNKDVLEEYEEEEEEEVENGMLSTEELDKKFDEFIRRMKEELRIEAQRQLIMAV